ncbi:hypothetical protein CY35_09G037400 [Sphagnum magellanicum]|nr:hypothetical protein CY35_09G037400 [Sphagnum magellanicum]KAH9551890.1 hypothetical protein CY35_09G037400 [Sphagnum magellanicum]KAH9551891.1 hypothetical protein CY35_09G037400 [Sphagnum magellanicum]
MHIVRGVSAFLRKSSNNNFEVPNVQSESLVQPSSWPEVEFSKDEDEAVLDYLWQKYQEASELEETQKALECFLVSFVQIFEDWAPVDEPQPTEVQIHVGEFIRINDIDREAGGSMSGSTVVGCKQGHPKRVTLGLIDELKGMTRSFTALHASSDGISDMWLSPSDMEAGLRLLKALSILTRSFHNRRIYFFFGGLQTLMVLMKSAVVQLKGVTNVVISDNITSLSASMQLGFLQCLIAHIVSVVANYIDAEARLTQKFGMPITSLEPIMLQRTSRDIIGTAIPPEHPQTPRASSSRRSSLQKRLSSGSSVVGLETSGSQRISVGAQSPGRSRSARDTSGLPNGSVPLLETGGLNWFVELLRILRKLRLKGAMSDVSLEQLALRTLKLTIFANPRTQNHFRSIGGVEVLLDGLGTPSTPSKRYECGTDDFSSVDKGQPQLDSQESIGVSSLNRLLDDFQMQTLSLQVLREAVFHNVTCLQCMRDNGGIQKFIDLIRWAAFTFPEMTASLIPVPDSAGSCGKEGGALMPGSLPEVKSRRNVRATPSGFLSIMLNVTDPPVDDDGSITSVHGLVDAQNIMAEGASLQGWNWRVSDLCRILCSFLVPAGEVASLAGGLQGGQDRGGASSLYWELATRCIVNVLLGVFRGVEDMGHENKALQTSRLLSSTLQHYTLCVLKKLLELSPSVLQLYQEDGVWDVMFSQYFFYFGLGDYSMQGFEATAGSAMGSSLVVTAKRTVCEAPLSASTGIEDGADHEDYIIQIPDSMDMEPLRLEVISFVELAATVNGTQNNSAECRALLEALHKCSFLANIATMLAKSLHRILQLSAEPTISAFQLLDASTVLSQVMERQRQASVRMEKGLSASAAGNLQGSVDMEFWMQARLAVFAVVTEYFAISEEAVNEAMHNPRAVDTLFNLLWESSTRDFALHHILLMMKATPTCKKDRDAKMDLCLKYLGLLPRAQVECQAGDISLVLDLLAGLRDILYTDVMYYQELFPDGECFLHIVSLLHADTIEPYSQVSLDVVNTLTHMLQGNELLKGAFRLKVGVGYKRLQSLLIAWHKGHPTQGLLDALLDMLVDGGFQIPSNMLIQNEDVVLLFFGMLQHCDEEEKLNGLDTFHRLLEESTANQAACVRAGLLSVLLDWFALEQTELLLMKMAQLIRMIGGHSISGKDMRRIFALLRSTKDGSRPHHGTLLLQSLQGMLKEQGPAVFFELSGHDSGIAVRMRSRRPSNRGYSFCCWARVENFPLLSSRGAEEGRMTLYSFSSESGKGCTLLLCNDQLVVESVSNKHHTVSLPVRLHLKHWYFICITHSGRNSLKVFLDGKLVAIEKLRYPKMNDNLSHFTVGTSSPLLAAAKESDSGETLSSKWSSAFCGQLGPLYLFEDAMSPDQVMAVYSLGANYMYAFLPSEVGCVPENVSTQSVIDSKDGLASKMIFGFNAQASAGRSLFDVSPMLEQSPAGELCDAVIMAGTHLCCRHLVQDIVHCVGGIGVFFPLLTQLDQPVAEALAFMGVTGERRYVQGCPVESHVVVEVIELVTGVLAGNFANQQYMHNIAGMAVLGFLLQSVLPQNLTIKVVSALEGLLTTVAKANGAALSEALVKEALMNLFLNPHIWIFTPFVVQRELYTSLLNYATSDTSLLPSIFGLPWVLDSLRQFYWDKPKSRRALGTKPLLHPITKAVIGERPTQLEIAKLRVLVLELAERVLRGVVTLVDTKVLVVFLDSSEDIVCLQDVLSMVIDLLEHKPFLSTFAEHVSEMGGCQIFIDLLKRQQEPIRLLALQLIGALLVVNLVEKKASGGSIQSTSKSASDKQKLSSMISLMSEHIMVFPITDALFNTLFDIMLGRTGPKQGRLTAQDVGPSQSRSDNILVHSETLSQRVRQLAVSTGTTFVLPQVLRIILKLVVSCEDPVLRLETLQYVLCLLEANPVNSEALTLEPAWQGWLFAALVAATNRSKKSAGNCEETVWMMGPEEMLIRKLFCMFHVHCVCALRDGWQHVEHTLNFIHLNGDEGLLSKFHTLHVILADLFDAMVQGLLPLQASLFTQPCRNNALYLLALVDELVMGDAFRLLPFPFPIDAILAGNVDRNPLLEEYSDLGFSTTAKPVSRRRSAEEAALLAAAQGSWKRTSLNRSRGWQRRTPQGEVIEIENKREYWRLYDKVWSLLIAMNGRGAAANRGNFVLPSTSGQTFGQRARGLVESLNIPASEIAAAVVSGGLGVVSIGSFAKVLDKSSRSRGERCPRVVLRLVLLYLFEADLDAASRCVQQFIALLPAFFSTESEQNKNRLQLLLWTLLDARTQIGSMDEGARFHVVSQLIREIVEGGKAMLATSLMDKDKPHDEVITASDATLHSLLQQDRILAAVKEEARYLKGATAQRAHEVEALRAELNTASAQESKQKKVLDDQIQTAGSSICASDRGRRVAAQGVYDEEQQAISEHWCHMFRDLTDERGPWSAITFPNDSPVRWKLDKTEDPLRRRLKLKRNYNFHEELLHPVSTAAPSSQAASEPLNEPGGSAVELLLGGVRTFLLKGLHKVTEDSNSEDEGDDDDDVSEEETVAKAPADDSQKPEKTVNASNVAKETGVSTLHHQTTAVGDAGEEEVLLSVACVLVAPKRKVAGHLKVMRASLHFHGEFVVEGTAGRSVFNHLGGLSYPDGISSETPEKGTHRLKGRYRKESFAEAADLEKSNYSERLDLPQQNATTQGPPFNGVKRHKRWDLSQVRAVHASRYLLQYSALEIFFTNSLPPVFFNFPSQRIAKDVGTTIIYLGNGPTSGKSSSKDREDMILYVDKRKVYELAEKARERWRRREISNFEYLMTLNTLAGRSYNDLTQYPVFPWVLADYTSEKLDLSNPATFRDLSKPVGALDTKRFKVFEERYHNFSDPDIPSFYYGSHYSSMGIVLFYLLRLEPFTSLHRRLQGGKFDHADRLFHSVEGAYRNCLTNTSDVKELIPEFFYLPEFALNTNDYYLGEKQDGELLSDVVLPAWAKGSAEEFVQKNREALESEYVSEHLHEWVDLIFGYKQRGQPAVEAANVFYHLTYEGFDLEALDNPVECAAVEDQIANFGQTPIQLFKKKHHKRGPAIPVARPLYYAPASITLTSIIPSMQSSPLMFVGLIDSRVVTVNSQLTVNVRPWITPSIQGGGSFTFSSQDSLYSIGADVTLSRRLGGRFAEDVEVTPGCFGTLQVRSSSFLLTCGHWDNSFKVISLSDGRMVQSNRQHTDIVTCLSVAVDGSVVVTGSCDTTVMVWDIELTSGSIHRRVSRFRESSSHSDKTSKPEVVVILDKPRHVLCGHDDSVTCIAVRVELDIVVSGSKDTTCILHTLRDGTYVRSLQHPNGSAITMLAVSQHGLLVMYSKDDLSLYVFSINGKLLAHAECKAHVNCMDISDCGDFLVCGGKQGQVVVRSMHTLEVVRLYDGTGVPISALAVTPEDCFIVGTEDGSLLTYSLEIQQQRKAGFFAMRSRSLVVSGSFIPGS